MGHLDIVAGVIREAETGGALDTGRIHTTIHTLIGRLPRSERMSTDARRIQLTKVNIHK